MKNVYLVGTAMSRFGVDPDKNIEELVGEPVNGALSDATAIVGMPGVRIHSDVHEHD